MDDNFVPSLVFEPADQVLPDQIVEEFSLSGLNLKKDSVENNTEIENRSWNQPNIKSEFKELKVQRKKEESTFPWRKCSKSELTSKE